MAMVVLGGSVGIILFGMCVEPLGGLIDGWIERGAHALLALIRRPANDRRVLNAKLLVGLLFCHGFIAMAAGAVYNYWIHVGDQWSYFDCYYFAFVTFSSIGFGDFAVGPPGNSWSACFMVLVQAYIIYVGMAFFNSFAGVSGEWAEAHYLALPCCRMRFPCTKQGEDDGKEATEQAAEAVAEEADETNNGDAKDEEAAAGGGNGSTSRKPRFFRSAALAVRPAVRPVGLVAMYLTLLLAGGHTFLNIEAEVEAAEAQALREQENSIRLLAGMPLKGVFAQAEVAQPVVASDEASSGSDESGGRRFLSHKSRRLQSEEDVRAQLLAVGEMSEEDQAAAVEEIVDKFTSVVDHEQGCDKYADLTKFMLDNCKQSPPDPVSLNWSFNGAVFFMMTVMTTIGYGTFAPETVAGKFVVITVGYISLIVFGIHLGSIGAEIEALVEWEAEMMLAAISWLELKLMEKCGRAPDLDGSNSGQGLTHCKMVAATCTLHLALAIAGGIAYSVSVYFNGEQWEYGACYYFAFASFSTIGFGDFAFGPSDDSFLQFINLFLQAPVIFLGLASFNTFASIGGDYIKETVPSLPWVLGFGCAFGMFLVLVVELESAIALSLGIGLAMLAAFPKMCCIASARRVAPAVRPGQLVEPVPTMENPAQRVRAKAGRVRTAVESPRVAESRAVPQGLPAEMANAAHDGDTVEVIAWLDGGGHVDSTRGTPDGQVRDLTLLMFASGKAHAALLELLLQRKASVNLQNSDGHTALMWAACYGHLMIVQRLLHAGANPRVCDADGDTALQMAECNGHAECARVIRESPAWKAILPTWDDAGDDADRVTYVTNIQTGTAGGESASRPQRARTVVSESPRTADFDAAATDTVGAEASTTRQKLEMLLRQTSSLLQLIDPPLLVILRSQPHWLQRGVKLVKGVLYRLIKQTVAGYAIMLIGGLLLYAVESQVEKDAACSARAEENLKRVAMRLLPMVDQVCS